MLSQFETQRLLGNITSTNDAAFILELLNTPKWLKYIGDRNLKSEDDAARYIQTKMIPQYAQLGFGNYTLTLKKYNIKIGTCGLYNRNGLEGVDLGFALLPCYEGKGYAFEAAKELIECAYSKLGFSSVMGITVKENYSSQKLLKRLGIMEDGSVVLPNETVELVRFIHAKNG